jgi:hypothetical protein
MTNLTMTAAPHGDRQVLLASELEGGEHIGAVEATHDQGWVAINPTIPDAAGEVVVPIIRAHHFTAHLGPQRLKAFIGCSRSWLFYHDKQLLHL